jgi:hypothetical protein
MTTTTPRPGEIWSAGELALLVVEQTVPGLVNASPVFADLSQVCPDEVVATVTMGSHTVPAVICLGLYTTVPVSYLTGGRRGSVTPERLALLREYIRILAKGQRLPHACSGPDYLREDDPRKAVRQARQKQLDSLIRGVMQLVTSN